MSTNRGKKSRRSRKRSEEDYTRKESTPKYRPILRVGKPFSDLTQPTRLQIWLDRLKKAAKRLGGIAVATLIGKLVAWVLKRFFNIS